MTMLRNLIVGISVFVCLFLVPQYPSGLLPAAFASWRNAGSENPAAANGADVIVLEDFARPVHEWKEMNDPVMGGESRGTFSVVSGVGVFRGHVVNVPFLQAPGFIQSRTIDHIPYPDVSSCQSLQLEVKAETDYDGYRFSFGRTHAPGGKRFAFGYKVTMGKVDSGTWRNLTYPLSDFTDYWDDATGDAIRTCQEEARYCPDVRTLRNLGTMAIWGEGKAGNVSLAIKGIRAMKCASD